MTRTFDSGWIETHAQEGVFVGGHIRFEVVAVVKSDLRVT